MASIDFIGPYTSGELPRHRRHRRHRRDHRPGGAQRRQRRARAFPRHGIDLPNIAFGAQTTLAYSENSADTDGMLTVSDGRHAASIVLLGNYMAGSFVTAADGHGGTLVTETQTQPQPLLSHPRA